VQLVVEGDRGLEHFLIEDPTNMPGVQVAVHGFALHGAWALRGPSSPGRELSCCSKPEGHLGLPIETPHIVTWAEFEGWAFRLEFALVFEEPGQGTAGGGEEQEEDGDEEEEQRVADVCHGLRQPVCGAPRCGRRREGAAPRARGRRPGGRPGSQCARIVACGCQRRPCGARPPACASWSGKEDCLGTAKSQ